MHKTAPTVAFGQKFTYEKQQTGGLEKHLNMASLNNSRTGVKP